MGPEEADLEALYRGRYAVFVAAAASIVGRESAVDVVQEAFVRALRRPRRSREAPLEAWVWRIVVNGARDVARRRGAAGPDLVEEAAWHDEDRDPELAAMIRELPPRRRTVLFLRYFADFSNDEIAAICQISSGTVAATLARARASLRSRLEREKEDARDHRR